MRHVDSQAPAENIFEMFACVPDELDPDTYYMEHAPYIQCYTYDRRLPLNDGLWRIGAANATRVVYATLITVPQVQH